MSPPHYINLELHLACSVKLSSIACVVLIFTAVKKLKPYGSNFPTSYTIHYLFYSYRLKISQAVLYLKKLPDDFTQADVDDYLTMLLDRIVPGGGIDKRGVWPLWIPIALQP